MSSSSSPHGSVLRSPALLNLASTTALFELIVLWLGLGPLTCVLAGDQFVYVGTYNTAQSKGIYMFRFSPASGQVTSPSLVAETKNPSFLDIAPTGQFLYAVNESDQFREQRSGALSSYRIDRSTGGLTKLNQVLTRGSGPCHLAVSRTAKCVVVANYGGGSVASFPILSDGSLGEAVSFFQHEGKSANPRRQEKPHAHGVTFDLDQKRVLVPDLGTDKLMVYSIDTESAKLVPNDPPALAVAAGAGPRHIAFHPNGRFAYVVNELACTVTVLDYDAASGALSHRQTVSTLPDGFSGDNTTAEIEVHRNGRLLFASNRGYDSLAVFGINRNGSLRLLNHTSTQGKTPRHFATDPTGEWLWVGNQNSNMLVLFRLDARTGTLMPAGQTLELGAPVCVKYLPLHD